MQQSKVKLQRRNNSGKNRKNKSENIHFLIEQIPKYSYEGIVFFKDKIVSYEEAILYCEFLYNEGLKNGNVLDKFEEIVFDETDKIIDLIAFLEENCLSLVNRLPVFDKWIVYDFDMSYLKQDIDENLKVGITKVVNHLLVYEGDTIFDCPEIEYTIGEENVDTEDEFGYSIQDKKDFYKITKEYYELYKNYRLQSFDFKKQYSDKEKKLNDLLIKLLTFDSNKMYNSFFQDDNCNPFDNIFIASIRQDDDLINDIFDKAINTRCSIMGEIDIEYIGQSYYVENGEIKNYISDDEIKRIQKFENNIDELCAILKNEDDESN